MINSRLKYCSYVPLHASDAAICFDSPWFRGCAKQDIKMSFLRFELESLNLVTNYSFTQGYFFSEKILIYKRKINVKAIAKMFSLINTDTRSNGPNRALINRWME